MARAIEPYWRLSEVSWTERGACSRYRGRTGRATGVGIGSGPRRTSFSGFLVATTVADRSRFAARAIGRTRGGRRGIWVNRAMASSYARLDLDGRSVRRSSTTSTPRNPRKPGEFGTTDDETVHMAFKDQAVFGYGTSIPPNNYELENNDSAPKRVIFCVHGKLSGCCTVVKALADESSPTDYQHDPINLADHCHRERDEAIDKKARKKLIIACILCVVFMIAEIVGGVMSNSLAIATDAAHLLTDFASFLISLFSIWMSARPPTRKMPFGWYRAEVIGALTSVLLIWVVTGILFYLAVERIIHENFELDAMVMLITSAVGVAVNLVMGLTLHQHGHSHGGGGHSHGSHGHAHEKGGIGHSKEDKTNINVRAAYIHVLGDFIQSTGVFIAALIIYFKPSWQIVDPICTFLFSILVLFTTLAIIKDVVNVLMEGTPRGFEYVEVESTFMQISGVVKVHNLRIWALSLDKTALSAHLAITPGSSPHEILRTATRNIHDRYNFFEMTLQIEEFNEQMENCNQCKSLQQ